MEQLVDTIVSIKQVDELKLPGLGERRKPVFSGGVAVLMAIFRSLSIDSMRISDGSLREGVLADLIGRRQSRDTRSETVADMIKRHHIDESQAERVRHTANVLFLQVRKDWMLSERDGQLLGWAALLHEIGLMIAHGQYHKHSAYMLENMDLAGFSRQEQKILSALVRLHRRKFREDVLADFEETQIEKVSRMAAILRLAVLFNRGRYQQSLPKISLVVDGANMVLQLDAAWLQERTLTQADLEDERSFLQSSPFSLEVEVAG